MKRTSSAALVLLLASASFAAAADTARYDKALEAFNQQIYLTAVSEARAQLAETPSHIPSWLLISRSYLKLKKCPEAGGAAASALTLINQSAGSGEALRPELDRVFSDLDVSCGASVELARAYVQSKDYEKAAGYYRGYLEKSPADLEARLEYARVLSWSKNYPEAATQYRLYLKSRPEDTQAVLGLADVYAWNGDQKSAEAQLRKALARDSGNVEALVRLGRVLEWQSDYKGARDAYERAQRYSPNDESAREGYDRVKDLANAKRRPTSSASVLEELEKTGDTALYLKLGDAYYYNEGKVDDALAAYRRYIRDHPEDDAALLKLARVLGWEKRYDESTTAFREYLVKKPGDEAAHLELASVLAWQGRYASALAELDLLKQQNPASVGPYLLAGDVLRWKRDFPEARDNYRKALELDPGNARARQGLTAIDLIWSTQPVVHGGGEYVSVSDIAFRRFTQQASADFHLAGGRVTLSPGVRNHEFRQQGADVEGREGFVDLWAPLQDQFRWHGGIAAMDFLGRGTKMQGHLGVEGSISTHTWVRLQYVAEDNVFDSNNLSALLARTSIRLNRYDMEGSRVFFDDNELSGLVSAGFLTDGNSRARALVQLRHRFEEAPFLRVGAAFKTLSYAQTSPLYWSPSAYSGPGLSADVERIYGKFSYRVGLRTYRITQTHQTEASFEGGAAWRSSEGFFAEFAFESGRGAGSAAGGTTNTAYRDYRLDAGWRF